VIEKANPQLDMKEIDRKRTRGEWRTQRILDWGKRKTESERNQKMERRRNRWLWALFRWNIFCIIFIELRISYTEAEFLDVIGTKVLKVFLLAIHSHLY
jgi:hypothetical protein